MEPLTEPCLKEFPTLNNTLIALQTLWLNSIQDLNNTLPVISDLTISTLLESLPGKKYIIYYKFI